MMQLFYDKRDFHRRMIIIVIDISCDLRTEGHGVPSETRKRNLKF